MYNIHAYKYEDVRKYVKKESQRQKDSILKRNRAVPLRMKARALTYI